MTLTELGPWSEWSQCSLTCGGGKQRRTRECGLPKTRLSNSENPCKAPLAEDQTCNEKACPVLTQWTDWSECSKTCGGGYRKKTRECQESFNPFYDVYKNPCKSPLEVVEECNDHKCPMWTEWGEWTDCSATCGGGKRRKYRQCVDHQGGLVDISNCPGPESMSKDCNTQDCPTWTDWTAWTQCSATCGGGSRSRVRECIVSDPIDARSSYDDSLCVGESQQSEECATNVCPVWTEWTDWTQCSASCGGGVQKRVRDCILPKNSGSNDYGCAGEPWEMRSCNDKDCPIWTDWSDWSPCTRSCGGGKRVKTRQCVLPETLGKEKLRLFCPGDEEVIEDCNTERCPVPGQWTEWSQCSKSCGGGTRTKVRECINRRDRYGNPCNADLTETESCNDNPCPVWTEWSDWTPCTQTCGGGMRKKARECILPKSQAYKCTGESEVIEKCNERTCPSLTPWTDWSSCTVTCGGGSQKRIRECLVQRTATGSNPCQEPLEETIECNQNTCPKWTDWSEWTSCSASCNGGTKTRVRECAQPRYGDEPSSACGVGDRNETTACNQSPCPTWTPWTEWTPCSASCGGGTQHRARECVKPTFNARGQLACDGVGFEDRKCNTNNCPQWTEWSPWSECTSSCGGGTRMKTRRCPVSPFYYGKNPCGNGQSEVTESCNEDPCLPDPEWSGWGEWSSCSQTCGGGTKQRSRTCEVASLFDLRKGRQYQEGEKEDDSKPCPGPSTMVLFCNMDKCPPKTNWGPWGPWSECTKNCGGGTRTRKRECQVVARYGQPSTCPGSDTEEEVCNDKSCIQWTEWGPWSQCSQTCGKGKRSRYRKCKSLEPSEIYNYPKTKASGFLFPQCLGEGKDYQECDTGRPCGSTDCSAFPMPNRFYSFAGRPASSIGKKVW